MTPQTTIIKEVQKGSPAESNAPAQNQSNIKKQSKRRSSNTLARRKVKSGAYLQKMSNLIFHQMINFTEAGVSAYTEHPNIAQRQRLLVGVFIC